MRQNELYELIQLEFKDKIQSVTDTAIFIHKEYLLGICQFLRDDERLRFESLIYLTAIDYPEKIDIVYSLLSLAHNHRLMLKCSLDKDTLEISSVEGIWKSANWDERETYEMFGVKFTGHPDLRRLLLPSDWEGYPLRKEYPLKGK